MQNWQRTIYTLNYILMYVESHPYYIINFSKLQWQAAFALDKSICHFINATREAYWTQGHYIWKSTWRHSPCAAQCTNILTWSKPKVRTFAAITKSHEDIRGWSSKLSREARHRQTKRSMNFTLHFNLSSCQVAEGKIIDINKNGCSQNITKTP